MFALTALVLSLTPVQPAVDLALAQQKIQIIKGKRGTVKAANAEGRVIEVNNSGDAARARELDAKEAQLNAKENDLAQREEQFAEKQAAQKDEEKAKAEQQKKQREQIEKLGEANQRAWQNAAGALGGN
ncbi:MAG: hypothetical protein DI536_19515 [Archangium gephyra]|uniref:Uncharacterized protein n=1 Tax=Archangium gephyra TaxID=48 RepID=A0A2W5UN25_9BACT|nr:MAG: hypothetical protein DI536_19515 [Archangium gephyra]